MDGEVAAAGLPAAGLQSTTLQAAGLQAAGLQAAELQLQAEGVEDLPVEAVVEALRLQVPAGVGVRGTGLGGAVRGSG